MMIWFRAFVILLVSAGISHAQAIAVRSGEHEGFSRLVVYTSATRDWDFGRVDDGYELRLRTSNAAFDVSRAFDLIPRTRITDIADLGEGRLGLRSDCNCHAKVFVAEGGQIVIDIASGPSPTEAIKFNKFLDRPNRASTRRAPSSNNTMSARLGLPLLPLPEAETVTSAIPQSSEHSDGPQPAQTEIISPEKTATDMMGEQTRIQQTELALIEQLGRAAAQGLVDANLSTLEAEVERVTNPTEPLPTKEPDPEPLLDPVDSLKENEHIAVQTSIDRESIEQKSVVISTQEGMSCLSDEYFAIETWGDNIENGIDLSRHVTGFLGEFDQPDQLVAMARVRHLIYLTFGAEAKALIQRYQTAIQTPDILSQMAEIMDEQQSGMAGKVAPQMGCDGKTALWAALAQPGFRPGQEINTKSILMSFSELPLHLRRHLGPSLAQKFLEFGDNKTAKALRNALTRAGDTHGPGYELLEARIELQDGDHDKAESRLTEIVNNDTDMSPQAALDFVNARLAQDRPVPERIIEIASTYAYEQRKTALGAELKMAEIRSLAAASDFEMAYAQIERGIADEQLRPAHIAQLHRDLLAKVTTNGSDSQFVRYCLRDIPQMETLDAELRTHISQRLLELGFTTEARAYLDIEGNVPDTSQRMIFAQIALKEHKPAVALGYLAGLESDAALMLRAKAMTMSKDYRSASQLFETLGVEDEQRIADWRSGDWQKLSSQTDSPLHEASRLMLAPSEDFSEEDLGPLARNATLLETSKNTRAALDELLSNLPTP